MSAGGEWLSSLWSWPQGLRLRAKSLVTSLKSKLVLESFCSLPSFAWKLDLRGGSLASALDSRTPHFLSSECSLKWDHTGELIWSQEPGKQRIVSACEDLPVVPRVLAIGRHVVMAPGEPSTSYSQFQLADGSDSPRTHKLFCQIGYSTEKWAWLRFHLFSLPFMEGLWRGSILVRTPFIQVTELEPEQT